MAKGKKQPEDDVSDVEEEEEEEEVGGEEEEEFIDIPVRDENGEETEETIGIPIHPLPPLETVLVRYWGWGGWLAYFGVAPDTDRWDILIACRVGNPYE
jgi:hypothetical protein